MDLGTKLRENYASQVQPLHSTENCFKPMMGKDELTFGVPNSSKGYLQDFLNQDQFQADGSFSNSVFGVQTPTFDPLDNFTYACPSTGFDIYECKHFAETNSSINIGGNVVHLMDNIQSGGGGGGGGGGGYNLINSFNLPHKISADIITVGSSSSSFHHNYQEIKPVNFVLPDEVSSIFPRNVFYQKDGFEKNRTSPVARKTYKVRMKSNIVKGQWTVDEDRLLIQLVEQYGIRKWSHIAQMLPGRIGKQCRERWHNHLRPDIKKDTWSEEEDKVLIQAHAEIGNKWSEIAKRLPGRTENSIKNHWNATKRRQYAKRKCRTKHRRGSLLQDYIKSLNLDTKPPIDYRKKSAATCHATTAHENNSSSSNINNNNNNNKNNINNNDNNNSMGKKSANVHPQMTDSDLFVNNDRLVPNFDFNEVPDFCFDDNMFQDGGCIASLLDDMLCAPVMEDKSFPGK